MIQMSMQMEETYRGKVCGKGREASIAPLVCHSPSVSIHHQSGSSLKPILWGSYGGIITQV